MPRYEELSLTLPDGYAAYARYWPADGQTRGAVLYHHGIQSHAGWYEGSAAALAAAGFAVLQPDRRGCGRNTQDRGHAESIDQLVADSRAAQEELARRSGCATVHLLGVSWGARLAVASYVKHPDGVQSLTLSAPGLFPRIIATKDQKWRLAFQMMYEPRTTFAIPLNDPELFTAEPEWQQYFREDPLTLRECTAGFYLASRRMDKVIEKLPKAPPVPVHLMLAGDERVIDAERTASFVRELGWRRCRITTYAEARHCLEFMREPEGYFGDAVQFLEEVAATSIAC